MLFLKYECKLSIKYFTGNEARKNIKAEELDAKSEAACSLYRNTARLCYVKAYDDKCSVVGVFSSDKVCNKSCDDVLHEFLANTTAAGEIESCEEITESEFLSMLRLAERNSFLSDDAIIIEPFNLERGYRYSRYRTEAVCEHIYDKNEALRLAKQYCCADTFRLELNRIYDNCVHGFYGHPVQYIVRTSTHELSEKIANLLVAALYGNKRLISKRYALLDLGEKINEDVIERIYSLAKGGTVVVRAECDTGSDEYANADERCMELLVNTVKAYRWDVLTIFCCSNMTNRINDRYRESLPGITFFEIAEDAMTPAKAKMYLKWRASEKGVKATRTLYTCLEDETKNLSIRQLDFEFERWFEKHLRTTVFPQYASLPNTDVIEKKVKGNAYQELSEMIGLAEPKRVIEQAVDYYKARILFADYKAFSNRPSLHMVFTGNPGTAKTTVARLFARIMYDNRLLSGGQMVEVGRADLVGKYIGWTAQIVKEKFKAAKGGVLFIDEAYALVDDRYGLYGDEAINTIVQEMENLRNDTVVIFAGYPAEMREFLARNPGLSSRIAFHIRFPDYTPAELMQIAMLLAERQGRTLSEGARERLLTDFTSVVRSSNFGNGRYVRNILEKAMMRQASRLVRVGYDNINATQISTLEADDFDLGAFEDKPMEHTIGFQ